MPQISKARTPVIQKPKLANSDASLHVSLKEGLTVFRDGKTDRAHLEIPLSKLNSDLGKGTDFAKSVTTVTVGAPYLDKDTELKATVKNGKLVLDIPNVRSGALGNNPLRAVVHLKNGHKALLEVQAHTQKLDSTADRITSAKQNVATLTGVVDRLKARLPELKKTLKAAADSDEAASLKAQITDVERSIIGTQKALSKAQTALTNLQKGRDRDVVVGHFDSFQ